MKVPLITERSSIFEPNMDLVMRKMSQIEKLINERKLVAQLESVNIRGLLIIGPPTYCPDHWNSTTSVMPSSGRCHLCELGEISFNVIGCAKHAGKPNCQ
jgi:hypothetical protein